MISRIVALLLLCIACSTTAWGFTSRTERWSEDVVLHDGRRIKVEREVDWTKEFHLLDPFFGLPIAPRFEEKGFDKFRIKFKHPDTQETIKWQGEEHYSPVLLDLINGVPYLVVYGMPNKETESIYGCHELPYTYLRYDSKMWGEWKVIPVDKAPDILRNANLSPHYPDFGDLGAQMEAIYTSERGGRQRRDMSPDDVQRKMSPAEQHSAGFFQRTIPRTYEEWNYSYKNNHRNERKRGDCRPPLQPLPDISLPKPIDIELEPVESKDYIVRSADEHYKSLREMKGSVTSDNCSKLFRPPNPENLMLGERFVNDPSGSKRLPYSGPTPFPSLKMFEKRTERYCDDNFVWFVAGHEELGKTIITKYSISGDFLYSIRMVDPKIADNNLARNMVRDSITAENGYIYFCWEQSLPLPANSSLVFPHRMTKFRFREPGHEAAVK